MVETIPFHTPFAPRGNPDQAASAPSATVTEAPPAATVDEAPAAAPSSDAAPALPDAAPNPSAPDAPAPDTPVPYTTPAEEGPGKPTDIGKGIPVRVMDLEKGQAQPTALCVDGLGHEFEKPFSQRGIWKFICFPFTFCFSFETCEKCKKCDLKVPPSESTAS